LARDVPLHLAIDLGAGSGRAMVGGVGPAGVNLREVHRFQYGPRSTAGRLRWDFDAIASGINEGIRRAQPVAREIGGRIESMGVDSWGVDYGLLDSFGRMVEEPISYRDPRTEGIMEEVFAKIPRADIFTRTGIQFLPFNTLFQLVAHAKERIQADADALRLLMIPDLCHHRLCGSLEGERTNASTTQLLNATSGKWDPDLFDELGLPLSIMPELVSAGDTLGVLRLALQNDLEVGPIKVIAPATHDTGSAVAGTPLRPGWAYVSSGTWSLVGVERKTPIVNAAAAEANFTNEGGAFRTVRFLKNVMGLWILEGCRREWAQAGNDQDYETLLAGVAAVEGVRGLIYPDHSRFFNPASMITAVRESLVETGQEAPSDPVLLARIILDSLALRYASVIKTIESLTAESVAGLHVVGGGALNSYLNQATADAAGLPVLAGPVEATALGNVLVQAIGCGEIASLSEGREALRLGMSAREFAPRRTAEWAEAGARYREIEARHFR
jgi:rhamnulokinase